MVKSYRVSTIVVLAVVLATSVAMAAGLGEPVLTLYYTASLNGNLDGCTCQSKPRVGLVKRAHYLRNQTDPETRVLVDAGDILHYRSDEPLAKEILGGYVELGYDMVAVGDQEFANGAAQLLEYVEEFPVLASHNLQICPDPERCVFVSLSPKIVARSDFKVGLFALTHPEVFRLYPQDVKATAKVGDPLVAAEGTLARLADTGVDITVLIYHAPLDAAYEMARLYPAIDVIVLGHDQKTIETTRPGGTIIVSPGQDGNTLGALDFFVTESGERKTKNRFVEFVYVEDPDDPAIRTRIDRYIEVLKRSAGN